MRSVALALSLLLALTVLPATASAGCRIDLGDPSNPRVYGDCLNFHAGDGTQGQEGQEVRAGFSFELAFDAPGSNMCDEDRCVYVIDQWVVVRVIPRDDHPTPSIQFESDGGAYGFDPVAPEAPCSVAFDPNTGVAAISGCDLRPH